VGVAVPDGLLGVAVGVAFALLDALADALPAGLAVPVDEAEPDEADALIAEPVGVPVAFLVPDAVGVGVAVGDWVSVFVLAGVVPAPGLFDRVRVAAEVLEEEGEGVVECAVGVGVVVVGVGVGVGVGVCVAVCVGVGVGVGVELGGGLGSQSAWHD
jgi:hypothetical protein